MGVNSVMLPLGTKKMQPLFILTTRVLSDASSPPRDLKQTTACMPS